MFPFWLLRLLQVFWSETVNIANFVFPFSLTRTETICSVKLKCDKEIVKFIRNFNFRLLVVWRYCKSIRQSGSQTVDQCWKDRDATSWPFSDPSPRIRSRSSDLNPTWTNLSIPKLVGGFNQHWMGRQTWGCGLDVLFSSDHYYRLPLALPRRCSLRIHCMDEDEG